MKNKLEPLNDSILEGIARTLGDTDKGLTGSEIARLLPQSKLRDLDPSFTKWKRIFNSFVDFQNRTQISNNIYTFILNSLNPARFVGSKNRFEELRIQTNQHLFFAGFQIAETGKLQKVKTAKILSEVEQRVNQLKTKLQNRNAHNLIFKFCKAELLSENYFHSVFEAVKSVAERIRQLSGSNKDGSQLIDEVFRINNPIVRINDLISETDKSEHKGFANLLKGVFGMFRNTTAHAPKIKWDIDELDALDILSTISLIHRKLDKAIV